MQTSGQNLTLGARRSALGNGIDWVGCGQAFSGRQGDMVAVPIETEV